MIGRLALAISKLEKRRERVYKERVFKATRNSKLLQLSAEGAAYVIGFVTGMVEGCFSDYWLTSVDEVDNRIIRALCLGENTAIIYHPRENVLRWLRSVNLGHKERE